MRPHRPGSRIQRPNQGGDGCTDGRTDGENFPYCIGLASPPVPSGAAAQKRKERKKKSEKRTEEGRRVEGKKKERKVMKEKEK